MRFFHIFAILFERNQGKITANRLRGDFGEKNLCNIYANHIGAFLKASQIISSQNGNIVRVNYNKAIDLHTMFIEVSATEENHKKIKSELEECNYLFNTTDNQKILIIVLKLQDIPGSVTPVLEILKKYKITIKTETINPKQTTPIVINQKELSLNLY